MKILPCRLINNPLFRCPRTMAPYKPLLNTNDLVRRSLQYVPPQASIISLRMDKIIRHPYFDNSTLHRDAIAISKEAIEPQKKLEAILKRHLSKYIAGDNTPDRPIREIKGRVKTAKSIREKVESLRQVALKKNDIDLVEKLETKKGMIAELSDLLGQKIILRSDDKKDTLKIMEGLVAAHKKGEMGIIDLEVYYPQLEGKEEAFTRFMHSQYSKKISTCDCEKMISDKDYFSYINSADMDRIAGEIGIKPKYIPLPTGYTAIHVGIIMPDGIRGEIQIVGCNVERLSIVEHEYYKAKCGKQVMPQLRERLKPIMPESKDFETQRSMIDYTLFAYVNERLKAKIPHKHRIDSEFLRAPQRLQDLGLGFNQNTAVIRATTKPRIMHYTNYKPNSLQ